jgi:hypothetical protein
MNNDAYNPVPHDAAFVEKLLSNPEVRREYERLENSEVEERWSAEIVRIGNKAVKEAQAKNRELGILNWYSVNGEIVNDAVLQESELNQQNREK